MSTTSVILDVEEATPLEEGIYVPLGGRPEAYVDVGESFRDARVTLYFASAERLRAMSALCLAAATKLETAQRAHDEGREEPHP